ncbi:hypothetical protein D3C85_1825330 [compost metagenome]
MLVGFAGGIDAEDTLRELLEASHVGIEGVGHPVRKEDGQSAAVRDIMDGRNRVLQIMRRPIPSNTHA